MIMAFNLTMPRAASWNGHWSGEDSLHVITRVARTCGEQARFQKLDGRSFGYRWPDGWCANIACSVVTADQAKRLRKKNVGFCGYEWMVESILKNGEIREGKDNENNH